MYIRLPRDLVKIQIWIQWIWSRDQDSIFITNSQVKHMTVLVEGQGLNVVSWELKK